MPSPWPRVLLAALCGILLCTPPAAGTLTTEQFEETIRVLSRQLIMQQLYSEERIRSDGDSGIKQIRHATGGDRPYYAESHTGAAVMSVHDHANNVRALGMGELVAVLNGVEFRTRHNDYMLVQPSIVVSTYGETVDIAYPAVPPEVLAKTTVADQVREMSEWFRAWRDQDTTSGRDYRPYFRPLLCYLEASWTTSDAFREPFVSDRHAVDAHSWRDLQEKVRFTGYGGGKSRFENYAFLPTTVVTDDGGTPTIAQWNYRILCHPLAGDLPLNRLRVVDELATRLAQGSTLCEYAKTRAASFELNQADSDEWVSGRRDYSLLDSLMAGVPGQDNYRGYQTDTAFNIEALEYEPDVDSGNYRSLNAAYYHRWFRAPLGDAMGRKIRHRGFSDSNLFMAMNTREQVVGSSVEVCDDQSCDTFSQKWSYAIPLEIVYLTPLLKWNPYGLEYKGEAASETGQTVTADGRTGSTTNPAAAYSGTNSKRFYRTPAEFFTSEELYVNAADTVQNRVGVLDPAGAMHIVRASGTRIFMPEILGVGSMRTRFPIAPTHGEGSSVWKELAALKDVVLNRQKYNRLLNT